MTSVLVGELASLVEEDGGRLVLVGEDPDLDSLDLAALESEGVETVRISAALGPDPNEVRFANDGHLNERGHRRVADVLAPAIREVLTQ